MIEKSGKYIAVVIAVAIAIPAMYIAGLLPSANNVNDPKSGDSGHYDFRYASDLIGGVNYNDNITISPDVKYTPELSRSAIGVRCEPDIMSNESVMSICNLLGMGNISSDPSIKYVSPVDYPNKRIDILRMSNTSRVEESASVEYINISRDGRNLSYGVVDYCREPAGMEITMSEEEINGTITSFLDRVRDILPRNVRLEMGHRTSHIIRGDGIKPEGIVIGRLYVYYGYLGEIYLGTLVSVEIDATGRVVSFKTLVGSFYEDRELNMSYPSTESLMEWVKSEGVAVIASSNISSVEIVDIKPAIYIELSMIPMYILDLKVYYSGPSRESQSQSVWVYWNYTGDSTG